MKMNSTTKLQGTCFAFSRRRNNDAVVRASATSDTDARSTTLRKTPTLYRELPLVPPPPPPLSKRLNAARVRARASNGTEARSPSTTLRKNPILYREPSPPSSPPPPSSSKESPHLKFTPLPVKRKPEVLAPAGGWPQLYAACENGADAVYFGVGDLNARARASNFTSEELPQVMEYLHTRGVKGYLVLNVLVFDSEIQTLAERAQQARAASVDAVIVQDLGAVEIILKTATGLAVHGSTQMSITSAEGAAFAAVRGVDRVVVGRELSVRDISSVAGAPAAPEVEAFVHGALCVSYSGQCFSSESWGGRSANRGQCAQACRLDYGLLVDGKLEYLGDVQYLLSPQDLAAIDLIPQLMLAGVVSFKIEGRLKGPEYVALTTKMYRRAVDAAWKVYVEGESSEKAGVEERERMKMNIKSGDVVMETDRNGAGAQQDEGIYQNTRETVKTNENLAAEIGNIYSGGETAENENILAAAAAAAAGVQQDEGIYKNTRETVKTNESAAEMGNKRPTAPESAEMNANPTNENVFSEAERRDLHQVFARGQDGNHFGLTTGFLEGPKHQSLVRGRAPRHRGVFVGEILKVLPSGVVVKLQSPLRRGDGVVFDQGDPQSDEFGGAIYEILLLNGTKAKSPSTSVLEAPKDSVVEIRLGGGGGAGGAASLLKQQHLKPGQFIWKNKDPVLESRLKASFENVSGVERRRVPVDVEVAAAVGSPLKIVLIDRVHGHRAVAETDAVVETATGRPLTENDVVKALGKKTLGDDGSLVVAAFDFSGCDFTSGGGLFISAAGIKDARRRAVAAFLEQQIIGVGRKGDGAAAVEVEVKVEDVLEEVYCEIAAEGRRWSHLKNSAEEENGDGSVRSSSSSNRSGVPVMRVLCRTKAQVDAAVKVPWLREVVLDFLEVHGLKEACEVVRHAGKRVVVASPRILKPEERRLWLFYLRLGADALLVRSAGLLHQLMEAGGPGAVVDGADGHSIPQLEGDFSLNAANTISADLLLRAGLTRLAPTHDCNAEQLIAMARGLGPRGAALEAILHQNLPIFHTEHCVFARFLSTGDSYLDCGHPCEHHTVHLRDGADGKDHLVLADMGCRNTVFDAQIQSGLPFLDQLVSAGFGCFRVELVDQSPESVAPLLEGYRRALLDFSSEQKNNKELWVWMNDELMDANGRAHGVGTGSLQPRAERVAQTMKQTAAAKRAALGRRK